MMSKAAIIWLSIAASLVFVGSIIFVGVMTTFGWDFMKLSTNQYDTVDYEINEEFSNISIDVDTTDVKFVSSGDGKCSVECYETEKMRHSVKVVDGVLKIENNDTRKWYEFIGINSGSPKITVSLPAGEYGALSVKSHTGDVEISREFNFESIDILENTGDVASFASVSGGIKIATDTGRVCVENASAASLMIETSTGSVKLSDVTCEGDIEVVVSTGKASLSRVSCKSLISKGSTGDLELNGVVASERFSIERSTGDVELKASRAETLLIETNTGDVELEGSDASEIFIKTDTGDVEGTLLTEKVFITKTDTGRVRVPNSITGGRCEITTDTGDIEISIQ